jgi:hypothetical protein
MGNNGVGVQVEAQVNRKFAKWLFEELRKKDRVAAPDGSCEAFRFGAVSAHPDGLLLPWDGFADDPAGAVRRLLEKRRQDIAPVVLAEYDTAEDVVSLRVGRIVPPGRVPGAVLLG